MKQTKKGWLNSRSKGIGGSECSALLGLNPYMTNVELWEIKTGRRARDIPDNPAMKYGRDAERPLIDLFELDYPKYQVIKPKPFMLQRNKQYPFILGTVDGELIEKETGICGGLEIKTTSILASQQHEKWNDKVPDNYYCQILHYFLINESYKFFILKAQLKSVWDEQIRLTTRHYFFTREKAQKDLEILENREVEFWQEYVLKDKKPALILPNI
jgi:putative phage-type endonuclease